MSIQRPEFRPSMATCTPMRALPNEGGGSRLEPITIQWYRAMRSLLYPTGYNVGEIRVDAMEVGEARCLAAEESLRRGFKYLFFIDADVIVPPTAMQILVYHLDNNPDYDIASGVYTTKSDPPTPLVWDRWGEGVTWDWTLGDVLRKNIVGIGMGCALIRCSLFERLPRDKDQPWFLWQEGETETEGDRHPFLVGEDIYFCRRTVEEAGAKILVDTSIYCKHIDWRTGRQWSLRDDALPVRRLAEKLGEVAA